MAYDSVQITIASGAGLGASFTASYPSGRTKADYDADDTDHALISQSGRVLFARNGDFSVTFGTSTVTVTLSVSIAFAAGEVLWLRLDRGDEETDREDQVRARWQSTRAALVTHVAENGIEAGAIYSDGTWLYIGSTGATAISDLPGLVPIWAPFFTQFGAVGDGTTDNRAALEAATNDIWKGPLRLDAEKTFDVDLSPGETVALPQYTHIVGEPGASLVLNASGAGTTTLFGAADDLTLERVNLDASHATAGETIVLMTGKNRNRLLFNDFDGGVTDAGGSPSHIAHAINISDNDIDGFLSFGNTYRRLTRTILKTNASTATHKNMKFIGDHFEGMAHETFAFNNPDGTMQGMLGSMLTGANSIASDVGNSDHFFGGANVEGMVGSNFWVYGEYGEPLHVEENTRYFTFTNVAAYLTDANSFFSAQDYNEGDGTYKFPQLGALGNFVAHRATRGTNNWAIDLVNDASGVAPLKRAVIHDGVVSGWSSPGRMAEEPHTVAVTNVMAYDCGEAWQLKVPTLIWHDNYSIDNDAGLDLQSSGFVGHVHFYREGGWDGTSSVLVQSPTVAAGHSAGFSSWSAEQEGITCAAAATNYPICDMGQKMMGRIEVSFSKSSTVYCDAAADIKWDGTTLTVTNVWDEHAGLSFVDFRDDGSGNLAIRINTGSEQTGCLVQATFRGRHRFT